MELEKEMHVKKENPSLVGMFTSPGLQFERIKGNPKIWVPLILISIIYVIGMTLMALSMDVEALIDSGVPEDQAEIVLAITKVTIAVTGIFAPIFGVLISSVIQLIIAKIANATVTFKQLFSMNTYIMIIGAIGLLVNMAIRFGIGGNPEIYLTSLAGLLNSEKAGVLGSFEVFGIWGVILTALGLHKTAQFSKGLAWTIAIVFFLLQIGFGLIGTLFQGAPKL
ncbi:YIP1 family protein [Neobacillus sp. MM2021_6]|uniref:Yip1 family protein n=1 Tax=Bacillaceae TaxID=186817 RepID=UPI00140CFA9E|nr:MULTISPECIES: Yip1 family protein [Bacillaceae]MBO0960446.1 YIP1 family protein [Neobacillus sp. MM2021_6]NHC16697.1 YIP1 family protein [Bacillus sp. MM2020_4]